MELKRALRLGEQPRLALVGAGGKTTALFQLAREFDPPVIVTASTHLAVEQTRLADRHQVLHSIAEAQTLAAMIPEGVHLFTGPIQGARTSGLCPEVLTWLEGYCRSYGLAMLIEADGSAMHPLKAPADHEPPIPAFVDTVLVVEGMSGVGKPLTPAWVHRPERFAHLSGLALGTCISPETVSQVLTHPQGGLKNIPAGTRKIVLLNQADTLDLRQIAAAMAGALLKAYQAVVVTALQPEGEQPVREPGKPGEVFAVHEPVAGIVLAAGAAKRYGSPKILLPWQDKPLVWQVAWKALAAGLRPVIMVCGAYRQEIESALAGLEVTIVPNPDWEQGQGTSVGVGVRALPADSGGAVFLLADQPQVPVSLLGSLVDTHARTLSAIVAPFVDEQRANPVLFDRDLFAALMTLPGDTGGRELFTRYEIARVPWEDPAILFDVDTPEDYTRLLAMAG
jgi:molybdenum cofactor cytidylyltransferase